MEEIFVYLDRSASAVQQMLAAADIENKGKISFAEFLVTCLEAKMQLSHEKVETLAELIERLICAVAEKEKIASTELAAAHQIE